MATTIEQLPRDHFLPLPRPLTAEGRPRRLGMEIEFSGLPEPRVAELLRERLGGTVVTSGPHELTVEATLLGDISMVLDTALRKGKASALRERGLELGREVIPVEVVLPPLPPDRLPELDAVRAILRDGGALGSRRGLFLGFGLHLNVEAGGEETIPPLARAFALLEDWLRYSDPIDGARRLLPFVDPWPRSFVRPLLGAGPGLTVPELVELYLRHTPTRNRALDLLPLFRHLHPDRIDPAHLEMKISARRAYHYRLPDSRVDEPDWTIAYEWNRWVLVETVAENAALLAELAESWLALDRAGRLTRHDWCVWVEARLQEALPGELAA